MYILGLHTGHDASACIFKGNELIAFCKEERLNRIKNDGDFFELQSVDEVLSIANISRSDIGAVAMTRLQLPLSCFNSKYLDLNNKKRKLLGSHKSINLSKIIFREKTVEIEKIINYSALRKSLGVTEQCEIHFSNHHRAHILSCFKFIDWPESALFVSCDGGGDQAQYSAYVFDGKTLKLILGGDETILEQPQNTGASIGLAYAYATEICGFIPNRHEGKLTGLAAFGKPVVSKKIIEQFEVVETGEIKSKIEGFSELESYLKKIFTGISKEDIAASIQQATEKVIYDWIMCLLKKTNARFIGLSGGVFSNVRLNQIISEIQGVEETFIFPAMGDEGLSVGACVDYLIRTNGLQSLERTRLTTLYLGRRYTASDLIHSAERESFRVKYCNAAEEAAELLAAHKVGAIYSEAMEMGPRALGARTILANPARRDINDSINKRLQRTEFMPFAPYVCVQDAENVFEISQSNKYACRFMTITTSVSAEWRDKIAAVVHVDGTARPQIIQREENPLYYDILQKFKVLTGLPVLVNTSFNAHEEPIINTPDEALVALRDNRVDFLVCEGAIISL